MTGGISNILSRSHPASVRRSGVRASLGWWLAGVTAALLLIDAATGTLLLVHYHPTIERAYPDVQAMRARLSLGIVRDLHYWSASATIIAMSLHIMRAILTASYQTFRRFGWFVSVGMLALVMLAAATGAMLRADQSGFGLIVGWLGGAMSAPAAGRWLWRSYIAHVAIIPLIMLILVGAYLWRSRCADTSTTINELPSPEPR